MIAQKKYILASSLEQANSLAKENSRSFRYLAGGTDVIVNKFQGNDGVETLIDITGIAGMKSISVTDTHLLIGALVCLEDLQNQDVIARQFPALLDAAHAIASPTIRKTASLGGNLLCENRCIYYNQSEWWREAAGNCLKCKGDTCLATGGTKICLSKFVSDAAIVLIGLEAGIELYDGDTTTIVPLESIYTGDGVNPRNISATAILKAIHIPLNQDFKCVFKKLRKRETLDFTSLSTVVSVNNKGKLRIVLGGVHPKPILVEGSKGDDLNDLVSQAIAQTRIVDNDTYSRAYRKAMITVFLKRSFEELHLE